MAWSSLGAGVIHGGVSPAHFAEWWGYGVFFLVAATLQVVYGLALLLKALDPVRLGKDRYLRFKRWLYILGLLGNGAILILYLLTRTVGIPLGPQRGDVEEVGPIDVASKVLEGIVLVGLAILLRPAKREGRSAPRPT